MQPNGTLTIEISQVEYDHIQAGLSCRIRALRALRDLAEDETLSEDVDRDAVLRIEDGARDLKFRLDTLALRAFGVR